MRSRGEAGCGSRQVGFVVGLTFPVPISIPIPSGRRGATSHPSAPACQRLSPQTTPPHYAASRRTEEQMPAYIIAEIEVTNPGGYESYRPLAGASVAQYGGKFL